MRARLALAAAFLVVLATASTAAAAPATISARIAAILRTNGVAGNGTGVTVIDADSGDVVERFHAWRRLAPASNEKLFVTVAAFTKLGPGFRFGTAVVGAGVRTGRVWHGNVYLVGAGDPTLSSAGIAQLAAQIRASGVRRISGHVIGDEAIFDTHRYGPHWKVAYDGIESPPLSGLAVDRDVDANGQIVANPAVVAARMLRDDLIALHVKMGAHWVAAGKAPAQNQPMARVQSLPLWQIVRFMDRYSDNFTAEMLTKALGHYAGAGGSTGAGIAVIRTVIDPVLGADATELSLYDGSGLSHSDRATASAFAHLLAATAGDSTLGPAIWGALSIAGVNGTLDGRMTGPIRARVRGKTGTLDGVSALSGFAIGRDHHRYAFSILMNGARLNIWQAHQAQDQIATLLATH